jgi:hypothetical protein
MVVLKAEDFEPHIGKRFAQRGQDRSVTLTSIDRRAFSGAENLPRPPFTLLFSGPAGDILPEGLHDFAVEDGPVFTIYINPVQTFDRTRQDYQAVFN